MMDYTIKRSGMICGSAEAEERVYQKVVGKNGVWLIAVQPNAADNVYLHDPEDTDSHGFAGRTIKFPLKDGSTYKAKGPWHSNSNALFIDTGVDVRDQHETFVVLSKGRKTTGPPRYEMLLTDVVYIDDKPTLGKLNRDEELAEKFPEAKFSYSESRSGSSCGPIRGR